MKVLHVPYCFPPDPAGGTEIYVESLAQCQRRRGVSVEIAAPAAKESSYTHDGLPVSRFAISDGAIDLREFYGDGDRVAAVSFTRVLERSGPDLVHLHAWTSGVSLRLVRAIKNKGIPVVFTYHTPTVSCVRGTLLRWGSEVCDGVFEVARCASCTLHGKGLHFGLSSALGHLPSAVGRSIGLAGLAGGVWTSFRASELMELRRAALIGLLAEADHVVAVCEWVRDLLIRNQADRQKLTLSRQGLREPAENAPRHPAARDRTNGEVRIAFLGRVARVKGIDVLLEAMRRAPDARLRLDIYGVVQDDEGRQLFNRFSPQAAADGRIRFLPVLAPGDVVSTLETYDALAVPSQWLETGPLVVYEAFAAGIAVLGSNLGGIAELVDHNRNGLLIEPASIDAWARALNRLIEEPDLLPRLRSGIPPVRTMDHAADEMLAVYNALLSPRLTAEPVTTAARTSE